MSRSTITCFRHLALAMLIALPGWTCCEARDAASLPPAVAHALSQYGIPSSSLSVFVENASNNDVLLSLNADVPRQPASTIKVLTTFVALDSLGPAHTWTTRAYATSPVRQGILDGDLILVGGGDPYMTMERWWSFIAQLRQTGLREIRGDIVIDRSLFAPLPEDRSVFDGQPQRSYNVVPDALMVNFQTSTFTIDPHVSGKFAAINVDPAPANLNLSDQVRLGSGGCRRAQQGLRFDTPLGAAGNALVIRGVIPRVCGRYSISRAIMSAPEYAYGTFHTLWEQSGGVIKGQLRLATLPPKAHLIYEFDSLTMAEIIRLVNKYSNNVMARDLLLTLATEKFGAPATMENGRRAVQDWLAEHQIDIAGLVIDNGSGLSRADRVTAHGLTQILNVAWHSQFMPEFVASLPLAGTDGTLRNRFRSPAMQGRIRMKTGHMDNVSSLAGYVTAASGTTYVVSIVVNHPGAELGVGDDVQAAILHWVFGQ